MKCQTLKKIINGKEKSELSTGMDCGWTNRTGHRYNSDVGHHIFIGTETRKVIALTTLNRICSKCWYNSKHDGCVCAINYGGSSKGMESEGAITNVLNIFNAGKAYVGKVVADDDSSTRVVLKHSHKDKKKQADAMELLYVIPQYDGGGYKSDHGRLPMEHPEPTFWRISC